MPSEYEWKCDRYNNPVICPLCGSHVDNRTDECPKCKPLDLQKYYENETKKMSLMITNGKREDLTGDEIHNLFMNKIKNHSRQG